MYVKISKTKSAETIYLMESIRTTEGKNTTRIVERLGTVKDLQKEHNDPIAWARAYAAARSKKRRNADDIITLSFNQAQQIPKGERTLFHGGYLFLQSLYYQLHLHELCNALQSKYRFEYNLNSILSRLLYGRILFPGSKLKTFLESQALMEKSDFSLHQIYRALDVLEHENDRIQSFVYRTSKGICPRQDRVLYYDCTNYFTEAEDASGLRQYGKSKENRPAPIVEMGLFMDASGIPLAFSVWPGNTNEQVTLKPLEEKIVNEFGHAKFIVCTDAGLSSAANRRLNSHEDRAFITTQSIKKLKKYLRDWALASDGWKLSPKQKKTYTLEEVLEGPEKEKLYDKVVYKERWIKQENLEQRLIVSFSPKYRAFQRNVRNGQIARAQKMIDERPESLKKKNAHDCRRFISTCSVTAEGEVASETLYALNKSVIAAEEMYDGFYAVCTNLEDGVEEIIRINKGRWEIEENFRITKNLLQARPIYVWLDEHIEAHFLTCFLSLLLTRLLERLIHNHSNLDFSAEELIATLRNMRFARHQNAWIPEFVRTDLTDKLEDIFNLTLSREILSKQTMRENWTRSKNPYPFRT